MLNVTSQDDNKFLINRSAAEKQSLYLKRQIELIRSYAAEFPSVPENQFFEEQSVIVPFEKKTVEKALKFIEYEGKPKPGKNRVPDYFPKPLNESSLMKLMPIWHCEFLNQCSQTSSELFNLLNCAIYLEAESLATILSIKIALKMQRCEDVDELRSYFGLEDDFDAGTGRLIEKGTLSLWNDYHEVYAPDNYNNSEFGLTSAQSKIGNASGKQQKLLKADGQSSQPALK